MHFHILDSLCYSAGSIETNQGQGFSTRENLSSVFQIRSYSNQPAKLQRLARTEKFSLGASFEMILSNKRITKALIRLRGCAGWSALLLFANPRRQVYSHRRGYYYDINQVISYWRSYSSSVSRIGPEAINNKFFDKLLIIQYSIFRHYVIYLTSA